MEKVFDKQKIETLQRGRTKVLTFQHSDKNVYGLTRMNRGFAFNGDNVMIELS